MFGFPWIIPLYQLQDLCINIWEFYYPPGPFWIQGDPTVQCAHCALGMKSHSSESSSGIWQIKPSSVDPWSDFKVWHRLSTRVSFLLSLNKHTLPSDGWYCVPLPCFEVGISLHLRCFVHAAIPQVLHSRKPRFGFNKFISWDQLKHYKASFV